MSTDVVLSLVGFGGTLLLVVVGLLNFTVFLRQLRLAREQIQTAVRQLEVARKQPEIQLIQRAITETSEHARLLVEKPYLRPYFYDNRDWQPGDRAGRDEVKAMAELMLNNFASAVMHAAAFPQYPVRGIDRIIMFNLRRSPALRDFLLESFERFPLTGLTLLCFKNDTAAGVEEDLRRLIASCADDGEERERREQLLRMFRQTEYGSALEFTRRTMEAGRGLPG